MINKEKLVENFAILRKQIPQKPKEFTSEFPRNLKEALKKYFNIRSRSELEKNTNLLIELNWPLPLWVNYDNINLGEIPNLIYSKYLESWKIKNSPKNINSFTWLNVPVVVNKHPNLSIDLIMKIIFDTNVDYVENNLKRNNLLISKADIISEAINLYKNKFYAGCICLLFPLIDYLVRKLLKTNGLRISVNNICTLFKQCGFTNANIHHLMPGVALEKYLSSNSRDELVNKLSSSDFNELTEKVDKTDFGIISPALTSFLYFSNNYYLSYNEDVGDDYIINRHGILHGSINLYNSPINAIKLFTYLYLILELEPIFEILFNEN